jgi:endoribonuclease Dicer
MTPILSDEAQLPHIDIVLGVPDGEPTKPKDSIAQEHEVKGLDTSIQSIHETKADIETQVVLALATRSSADVIADLKSSQREPKSHVTRTYDLTVKTGQENPKLFADSNTAGPGPDKGRDSEDECDMNVIEETKPRKVSERKRIRNAVYQSHLRDIFSKTQSKDISVVSNASIDGQSTRCLVRREEMKNIISSPREYQVELFERAKEKNIIAVLDTGKA